MMIKEEAQHFLQDQGLNLETVRNWEKFPAVGLKCLSLPPHCSCSPACLFVYSVSLCPKQIAEKN